MTQETFETINRMQEAGTMRKLRFVYYKIGGVATVSYMVKRGYHKEVIRFLLICCHAQYDNPELMETLRGERKGVK